MAAKQARAAHAESLAEPMSAEENQLMSDNQAAEHEQPQLELETHAPEVPAETTPVVEGEGQPDIDPATGKQRKVDYGAFHAEREKRKSAETGRQEAEKQLATAMGRFSVLEQLARQTQPKPVGEAPVEVPDINTDPVGHFKALYEQSQNKISDLDKWRQNQESQQTQYQNVQRLTQIALTHEADFSKTTPDYQDAASYVRAVRDQELQAMGYNDPAARQQIIHQDALQIAAQALQGNMNAAEVVYNIAKARGYQVKTGAKPAAPIPTGDIKKLETVANGQKQGSPLSEANGSAPAEMSVEAILKMPEADFAKWATPDNWRKIAGG